MDSNLLLRYIGMSLEYFCVFWLGMVVINCISEKNKTVLLNIFCYMAISCITALLAEAVSISFYERDGVDVLLTVCFTVSLIAGYSLAFSYTCYIANLVGDGHRFPRFAVGLVMTVGICAAAALIIGCFFGWFYTVENGMMHYSKLFYFVFAYDVFACLIGVGMLIRYRKLLKPRDMVALGSFPMLIFCAGVMQYFFYKMSVWLFLLAAVAVFIIYLMIQKDRNRRQTQQEKQLMDLQIALMLSQIQPHFLYNALSSIRRMIKKDPDVAEAAVENFALYLRQNLESLNRVEPIPFAEELRHLEEYLYLEKLRFGDRLTVEYDLSETDFVLPVLSLQPIVENAVKHGILKREEGGTVQISTIRIGNEIILTVADNGVGFDEEAYWNSKHMHIGLTNVMQRIQLQCSGKVTIQSECGVGTTVTVTLPQ